jgi:HTH-type transcriptional regulator/antitoxin HigA
MNAVLAEVFPPGELLADELEARGWTQAEFAAILGRPAQFVSEIISGKKEITRESAAQIGAALGTSAEMWLSLQDKYFLWKQSRNRKTQGELDEVRRRARLNNKAPVSLLRKAGVLKGTTLDELEAEVLSFFQLKSLDDEPSLAAAARRANHGESTTTLQTAWLYQVLHAAGEKPTSGTYRRKDLEAVGATLCTSATEPADFAEIPEMLSNVGVRLVYVPPLPGAKIDGCAMMVGSSPVIGLSGRGKRLDKVLFTLLHEIAHITLGHVGTTPIVETVESGSELDEEDHERQANEAAAAWVLPNGLPDLPQRISGPWITSTAQELGIAPIMLIGRLQRQGRLDWRTTLAKGAPNVDAMLADW